MSLYLLACVQIIQNFRCNETSMTKVSSQAISKIKTRSELEVFTGKGKTANVYLDKFICDVNSIYQFYHKLFREFSLQPKLSDHVSHLFQQVTAMHRKRYGISPHSSEGPLSFIGVHNRRSDYIQLLKGSGARFLSTEYFKASGNSLYVTHPRIKRLLRRT